MAAAAGAGEAQRRIEDHLAMAAVGDAVIDDQLDDDIGRIALAV